MEIMFFEKLSNLTYQLSKNKFLKQIFYPGEKKANTHLQDKIKNILVGKAFSLNHIFDEDWQNLF